jgi:hypothetical protein
VAASSRHRGALEGLCSVRRCPGAENRSGCRRRRAPATTGGGTACAGGEARWRRRLGRVGGQGAQPFIGARPEVGLAQKGRMAGGGGVAVTATTSVVVWALPGRAGWSGLG